MRNKALICECQDSYGKACGKPMTIEEFKQDGMCWDCADRVWDEMNTKGNTKWKHSTSDNEKMQGAKPRI